MVTLLMLVFIKFNDVHVHLYLSSGTFNDGRYWDVFAEYAKNEPDDILCKYTVINCGPEAATMHILPTVWYRNTWIWGCTHEVRSKAGMHI
jgi:hypothetical protein